jgi:hypothetical protein
MSTQLFEEQISGLNFSFLEMGKNKSGVLLSEGFEKISREWASPDILFSLETAKTRFQADAVYFRLFEDGRGFVPQLYLFDYTVKKISNEERNRIHIQMWNGSQVPAYLIIEKFSVSVFDSRKKPKEDKDDYAKEILTWTGEAIKEFKAKDFDNGIFWDEQSEKDFRFEESATRDLIRGLKEIFTSFIVESHLDRHVALKLLVQCLLIKYLEERDEKSASGYFAGTYFQKNFNCSNFCDTIRNGKVLDLLDQLSKDFNGKIFEWHSENELEERNAIQEAEVRKLADYLDGNIKDSQYVIWRLYSFSHLPVEVISSVYEELLTDSKDIVYTPEMIVSTLVDECMPIKMPKNDFKIIDVSCGSGIFLVKTYKRIVQWWRYEQWKKTGKLVKPSLEVLKKLLLNSIHGVDIEPDAIRLSVFSLALAILDEVNLDPPTWEKLKFPDLSDNIITQDFFEFIITKPNPNFDLVIGNPPFNLSAVNGKEPERKKFFKELKIRIGYESEIEIPDENPALHFMVQSLKLLKKNGLLCLIEPSGPILYQTDLSFKQKIFSQNNLLQVIDFTRLADKFWGRKNVATVAVFVEKSIPDNEDVLHLVANRTFSNYNRLFLEFDHYDFHMVTKKELLNSSSIWKANLLGGGRISNILEKFSQIRTLGMFLNLKRRNGWVKGEGAQQKGEKNFADYITGQDFIETESFTEEGLDKSSIKICGIRFFHRPREKELYTPPHFLIRKVLGKNKLITEFSDNYLAFFNGIYSIHCPVDQKQELIEIADYFQKNDLLIRFYILATSSRAKIIKSTSLYNEDILNIPYPENASEIKLSEADEIIISDSMNYFIGSSFAKNLEERMSKEVALEFANIFCKTLNSIYQNSKSFQLFKVIDAGKFYALHFEYASEEHIPQTENVRDVEEYLESAIPLWNEKSDSYHIQKIIKIYGLDSIILAKPKQLRYWLPSIALRDADETFADYFKSRHKNV